MRAPAPHRHYAFLAFLAYLGFVVYGSLVPFEYREYTFDQAIELFADIRYLDLGVESRADWVANIVLYVPLAFLGCAWLVGLRSVGKLRYLAFFLIFAFCIAVAVAVEFTQIFFAPRTVSLNDLLAETLGTLGGLAVFSLERWRIARLLDSFAQGGRESVLAAIVVFGLLYVALVLFPYDFVISWSELTEKLSSGNQGWFFAGDCSNLLRCGASQLGKAVAIAPLGILMALAVPRLNYPRVFWAGIGLGLVLEPLQLLLASGASQGLSVLLRGVGLTVGAAVGAVLRQQGPAPVAWLIRRATPYVALPYVLLLAALGGWFSAPWLAWQEALARLADVRIMPFYYHYFTTEQAALSSLLIQAGMYAPIGLAVWALHPPRRGVSGSVAWIAALGAAALALPIELGKLLVPDKHPDPTNLLIAAVSAAVVCSLASWLGRVLIGDQAGHGGQTVPAGSSFRPSPPVEERAAQSAMDWPPPDPVGVLIGLIAAIVSLFGMAHYPFGKPWLAAALLGYGALLWRRPWIAFFAVPAALPVLDLGPLTGPLWLDEFDLVVLVTFAVAYPRLYRAQPLPWPSRWLSAASVLLWTSWVVSSLRGLWPLLNTEGGVGDSSHSPLEAWLVGKGLLWALLLVPLLRRVPREGVAAAQAYFRNGLVAGLIMVSLVVLWERHVFVGLTDFENVFRVTGTFASMRTGGAYIEAYLAFAFPALVVGVLMAPHWVLRGLGVGAAALVSYAMMVTFSRGGYAGLVIGLVPVGLAMLRLRTGSRMHRWLALAGLVAASIAAAVPVLSGGFAQDRLARASDDLSVREGHWKRALNLMDDGPITALVGMGFGQYPMAYLMRAESGQPPGTYSVIRNGDNPYLRLGAGESVFLDQIVAVEPGAAYTLAARVRPASGDAALGVALCEKALLYSFECGWYRLQPETPGRQWGLVTVEVNAAHLGRGGNWPHRPVKLSLYHAGSGGPIDVDDVSLKTQDGRELLANGRFSDGAARWLLVTDQKEAWHIDQQQVEMYFAQGLLGLGALTVLLIAVARMLWPALRGGDLVASLFAGALAAFLTVGLVGSVMDTARLSMLFYMGAFCAGLLTHPGEGKNRSRQRVPESRRFSPGISRPTAAFRE